MRKRLMDQSKWWRLPTVDFGDIELAFKGFGCVGGPDGYNHVNMSIGDDTMRILSDCQDIIKREWGTLDKNEKKSFIDCFGKEALAFLRKILGAAEVNKIIKYNPVAELQAETDRRFRDAGYKKNNGDWVKTDDRILDEAADLVDGGGDEADRLLTTLEGGLFNESE